MKALVTGGAEFIAASVGSTRSIQPQVQFLSVLREYLDWAKIEMRA